MEDGLEMGCILAFFGMAVFVTAAAADVAVASVAASVAVDGLVVVGSDRPKLKIRSKKEEERFFSGDGTV